MAKKRKASRKENLSAWKRGTVQKEITSPSYPRHQRGGIQLRG